MLTPAERHTLAAAVAVRERLYSIEHGTSAQTVAKILRVLFADAGTILDSTWGTGNFWRAAPQLRVTGLDRSGHGRPDVLADFRALPFVASAFDVVVFDCDGEGYPNTAATYREIAAIAERRSA